MSVPTRRVPQERRSGLGLCHLALGVLIGGLIVYDVMGGREQTVLAAERIVPAPAQPPQTQVIVLVANTARATSIPTAVPTAAATANPRRNDCDRITPIVGQPCVRPPAPTPTEAPLPDYPDAAPGAWSVWVAPETDARQEME